MLRGRSAEEVVQTVTWLGDPPGDEAPVEAESYQILRSRIDLTRLPKHSRDVTERVIHASADFDYATDLVCDEEALAAAVAELAAGAPVIADDAMVTAGITGWPVICKIAETLTQRLARTAGITLASAAVRLAFGEAGPGAVWVVGGAPSALHEIITREVQPALVIGLPAGFVGAAEAKDALRASGLPSLSNVSEKGGPVAAAAAFTALQRAAAEVGETRDGPGGSQAPAAGFDAS
jgi:precorrin-8X/cobalt-precorrin-8 methylmutase